ncbi:MAG: hypothetical protein JWM78_1671 [Verrucomicrobiaceae bacterium]|nr:hypothetical protein [Verrucomicrobiaceae bacterium]
MLGERETGIFEIDEENWIALLVFIAMETQWRHSNHGAVFGLDYTALSAVMHLQKIRDKPEVFRRVQIMERAALPLLNKR